MTQASRITDITYGWGSHGLPCCPHFLVGVRVTGSSDVQINGQGASRAQRDIALHSCPHCSHNLCVGGSPDVFVNGLPLHRMGDSVFEFCGWGQTVTGSADVWANEGDA